MRSLAFFAVTSLACGCVDGLQRGRVEEHGAAALDPATLPLLFEPTEVVPWSWQPVSVTVIRTDQGEGRLDRLIARAPLMVLPDANVIELHSENGFALLSRRGSSEAEAWIALGCRDLEGSRNPGPGHRLTSNHVGLMHDLVIAEAGDGGNGYVRIDDASEGESFPYCGLPRVGARFAVVPLPFWKPWWGDIELAEGEYDVSVTAKCDGAPCATPVTDPQLRVSAIGNNHFIVLENAWPSTVSFDVTSSSSGPFQVFPGVAAVTSADIGGGEQRTLLIAPGVYDVRVYSGSVVFGVDVTRGPRRVADGGRPVPDDLAEIVLDNRSESSIGFVNILPRGLFDRLDPGRVGTDEFYRYAAGIAEGNWLGQGESIAPGTSRGWDADRGEYVMILRESAQSRLLGILAIWVPAGVGATQVVYP